MTSGGCGSSPGCAPTWCTSGPGTGRGWPRCWRALIKISAVVSSLDTLSARAMIEALIAGQRNPRALADLAVGRLRPKRAALAAALEGRFEPHHGELARILLDQIDALTGQIDQLTARITELIAALPAAQGVDADGATGPGAPVLPAVMRLDEITGCGVIAAQAIIAEIGLDMAVFGTPGRLVSRAKRCPQTRQSGTKTSTGKAGKGNPYLNGVLGEIAASAGRTDTFPRRALPPPGPPPRQAQSHSRRRPLHPGHHLPPAGRPRSPVPRPRTRLLRHTHRQAAQDPQPHPPARGPRPRRHDRTQTRRRLTHPAIGLPGPDRPH